MSNRTPAPSAANVNTGGGGGGNASAGAGTYNGGAGGSGIVILRANKTAANVTGNANVIVSGLYTTYIFKSSGTITF